MEFKQIENFRNLLDFTTIIKSRHLTNFKIQNNYFSTRNLPSSERIHRKRDSRFFYNTLFWSRFWVMFCESLFHTMFCVIFWFYVSVCKKLVCNLLQDHMEICQMLTHNLLPQNCDLTIVIQSFRQERNWKKWPQRVTPKKVTQKRYSLTHNKTWLVTQIFLTARGGGGSGGVKTNPYFSKLILLYLIWQGKNPNKFSILFLYL